MGADILIQHCTLRITRRGGWSWGANPRSLVNTMLQHLPQLIGERLADAWPAGSEQTIDTPLRLQLTLRQSELEALANGAGNELSLLVEERLLQQVDAEIATVARREAGVATDASIPSAVSDEPGAAASPHEPHGTWAGTVLAVLLSWQRRGTLVDTLLCFGTAVLGAWHDSLWRGWPATAVPSDDQRPERLAALAAEVADMPLPLPPGPAAALVRRIVLMVHAAGLDALSSSEQLREAIDAQPACRLLPADASPAGEPGSFGQALSPPAVQPHPQDAPPPRRSKTATPAATPSPRRRAVHELQVKSALPFLLLGPLSRCGLLETLAAVFDAAALPPADWPCFALGLARKVLAVPQRGWYREPGEVLAAAAFAGGEQAPNDAALADAARLLAPQLAPLDVAVANALTEGHRSGAPLLLQSVAAHGEPGWLLSDTDGLFPIAWSERINRLHPRLAALDGELLLVPQASVRPGLLRQLDDAGFNFVTDANPARGEAWRALHGNGLQAWSNDTQRAAAALLAAVQMLEAASAGITALWSELAAQRLALAPGSAPAFERSLALAAALSLGTISWSLWGAEGTVSPLLALQRFGDLDARIVFRRDQVQVHLPLGRRFLDLKRAGLLDDVSKVPWLGDRLVRFAQA